MARCGIADTDGRLTPWAKILHPQAFAQTVHNYQILTDGFVNLAAIMLPWLELLLGVCLIGGFWQPGATVVSTGLLTVFIGALVFNRIRGLDIHCGCFSSESTVGPSDLWTVARDLGFMTISIYLTLHAFFFRPATTMARATGVERTVMK